MGPDTRKLIVVLSTLAAVPLGAVPARAIDLAAERRALSSRLIMDNLAYPYVPNVPANGAVAVVRFEIGADGHVGTIGLDRNSGFAAFDRIALAAVRRASPLPRPPAGYPVRSVAVPIRFMPRPAPAYSRIKAWPSSRFGF